MTPTPRLLRDPERRGGRSSGVRPGRLPQARDPVAPGYEQVARGDQDVPDDHLLALTHTPSSNSRSSASKQPSGPPRSDVEEKSPLRSGVDSTNFTHPPLEEQALLRSGATSGSCESLSDDGTADILRTRRRNSTASTFVSNSAKLGPLTLGESPPPSLHPQSTGISIPPSSKNYLF